VATRYPCTELLKDRHRLPAPWPRASYPRFRSMYPVKPSIARLQGRRTITSVDAALHAAASYEASARETRTHSSCGSWPHRISRSQHDQALPSPRDVACHTSLVVGTTMHRRNLVVRFGPDPTGRQPHARLALPAGRSMLVGAAFVPRFVCCVSFSIRKSPRTSTRLGRGPVGGVNQ
jgi:hypothetical protein